MHELPWQERVFTTADKVLQMLGLTAEVAVDWPGPISLGRPGHLTDRRWVGVGPAPLQTPENRGSVAGRKIWVITHATRRGVSVTPLGDEWPDAKEYAGALIDRQSDSLWRAVAVSGLAGAHDALLAVLGWSSAKHPLHLHHVGYCHPPESAIFDFYLATNDLTEDPNPPEGQRRVFTPVLDDLGVLKYYEEDQVMLDGSRSDWWHLHVVTNHPRELLDQLGEVTGCEVTWFPHDPQDSSQTVGVVWVPGTNERVYPGRFGDKTVTIGVMASRLVPKIPAG